MLGTGDAELERLSHQHITWLENTAAHWSRAGFTLGHTILDLGCGPGFGTRDLARLVGSKGCVLAIDESQRFIDYIKHNPTAPGAGTIDARIGDARCLALDEHSIDGAYARWLFTFIDDLDAVVAGVTHALRPGGVFAIHDFLLHWPALVWGPNDRILPTIRDGLINTYRSRSAHNSVGCRLPAILVRHGLTLEDLCSSTRIARPGSPLWWWLESFLVEFLPRVVDMGFLSSKDIAAWRAEWSANAADPAGFFMTLPQIEIVARKPL